MTREATRHRPGAGLLAWVLPAFLAAVTSGRADLHFLEPRAQLGEVRSGRPLSHAFRFVNQGPGEAEILEVRPSCGCVVPRLDRRPVPVGKEGVLVLEANTISQPAGPHTWNVQVRYRADGREREAVLQMTTTVVIEVTVQPAALAVVADQPIAHEITITDVRPRPLALAALASSLPALKPQLAARSQTPEGHTVYRVRLEVADDCTPGRHDAVVLFHTDDPDFPQLRVPVTVTRRVRQRVAATPGQVELQAAPGQPIPSRVVLLRDSEKQGVVVSQVRADHPAVQCRWSPGGNGLTALRITIDRTRLQGPRLESAVQVELSAPVRETLIIPVTCTVE